MQTVSFNVPSVSCSNCSHKIQEGLKDNAGIGSVSVDMKTQTVKVDYDPQKMQPQEIKNSIAAMGYEVVQ